MERHVLCKLYGYQYAFKRFNASNSSIDIVSKGQSTKTTENVIPILNITMNLTRILQGMTCIYIVTANPI